MWKHENVICDKLCKIYKQVDLQQDALTDTEIHSLPHIELVLCSVIMPCLFCVL